MHLPSLPRLAPLVLALAVAVTPLARAQSTPDLSGTNDDSIREVIRRISQRQVHPLKDGDYPAVSTIAEAKAAAQPVGLAWDYPWGVALYGVERSTGATGDKAAMAFVQEHNHIIGRYYAWLQSVQAKVPAADWTAFIRDNKNVKVGGLLRLGNLDSCGAMGVQYLEAMLRDPKSVTPEEKAVVARIADWITVKQERLPDGTFWRPKAQDTEKKWQPGTLWIDDLYMGCPFLVRWAKYTGDSKYLHDAANNVINMAKRLQDTDGVWYHAYDEPQKEHSPFKWGRANGWAMVATVEILSALPENHPDRAALLDILRRHVAGVEKLQPASGVWHQVLDHNELWEETSCTAMFAYSIARAVNRGWIEPGHLATARKAFAGLCAQYITPDGIVKNTCEGTNIGMELSYYANRLHPDDDHHSRGVVQLAGTELLMGKK